MNPHVRTEMTKQKIAAFADQAEKKIGGAWRVWRSFALGTVAVAAAAVALIVGAFAMRLNDTAVNTYRRACIDAGGTVVEHRGALRCAKDFIPFITPSTGQSAPTRTQPRILT